MRRCSLASNSHVLRICFGWSGKAHRTFSRTTSRLRRPHFERRGLQERPRVIAPRLQSTTLVLIYLVHFSLNDNSYYLRCPKVNSLSRRLARTILFLLLTLAVVLMFVRWRWMRLSLLDSISLLSDDQNCTVVAV